MTVATFVVNRRPLEQGLDYSPILLLVRLTETWTQHNVSYFSWKRMSIYKDILIVCKCMCLVDMRLHPKRSGFVYGCPA